MSEVPNDSVNDRHFQKYLGYRMVGSVIGRGLGTRKGIYKIAGGTEFPLYRKENLNAGIISFGHYFIQGRRPLSNPLLGTQFEKNVI